VRKARAALHLCAVLWGTQHAVIKSSVDSTVRCFGHCGLRWLSVAGTALSPQIARSLQFTVSCHNAWKAVQEFRVFACVGSATAMPWVRLHVCDMAFVLHSCISVRARVQQAKLSLPISWGVSAEIPVAAFEAVVGERDGGNGGGHDPNSPLEAMELVTLRFALYVRESPFPQSRPHWTIICPSPCCGSSQQVHQCGSWLRPHFAPPCTS
jgi:hypothetical protein